MLTWSPVVEMFCLDQCKVHYMPVIQVRPPSAVLVGSVVEGFWFGFVNTSQYQSH